jgi:CubicO group peptidase (beta-lactamase class C family)
MISYAIVRAGCPIAQLDGEVPVPWWSFTKTAIATAALTLVRDRVVALDSPLPGYAFTLRQLLCHQAGLTDYGHLRAYHVAVAAREEPWSEREMLARTEADRLRYPPGEGWRYSNIGYVYVRRLIEDLTNESLAAALQRLVLGPLNITAVRLIGSRDESTGVRMGDAQNYEPRWVYHGLLAGPLQDAAVFLDGLMSGSLLPPELMRAMCEPYQLDVPTDGRPWIRPAYGLGVMFGTVANGSDYVGHTGAGPGSVIAVYHRTTAAPVTCATFVLGDNQGIVENELVRMIP